MTRKRNTATADLFAAPQAPRESLGADALLLRGFARGDACALFEEVQRIAALAPFRHMVTPGGYRMSVEMTNCGAWGWITDRRGYRYAAEDPETSRAWPAMPKLFSDLASRAATEAGFAGFAPDACLINRYTPGARLTLHQDKNERDFAEPIVSISLGLPATFLWGGLTRKERPRRFSLASGDVVVWGGASRLVFHGIDELEAGDDPLTGPCRINLTLRRAR